jgi:peptide subunit release factor RF-3
LSDKRDKQPYDQAPPSRQIRRRIASALRLLPQELLLFGEAIQPAGEVKPRGKWRWVRSDWIAVECVRGIPFSSAVMSFEHQRLAFNMRGTSGHQDFGGVG